MIRTNILGQLLDVPRQAEAMAQRAKALQDDPSFLVPGVVPNRFACLPLWRAICVFKGMNPAHWALTSPAAAASLERHTTGEVAARLKELVQLHTLALDGIKMGLLKAPGNETKGFETNTVSLIEWAALVGEAPPAQCPATDATSTESTPDGLDAEKKHPDWLLATRDYTLKVMKAGQYKTSKELFRALEAKAGSPESPFDKGTEGNRGSLFVRKLLKAVSPGTFRNAWPTLRYWAKN